MSLNHGTFSVLTDRYTSIALMSTGKRINNLPYFTTNPRRFITLKIGATNFILFNNGFDPFCDSLFNENAILFFPEEYLNTFNLIYGDLERNIENSNNFLKQGSSSPITTIPISDEIPRYYLGKRSRTGRDIRIVLPSIVYDLYMELEEFNLRKLELNPPVILMNKIILATTEKLEYCKIYHTNRVTQLEFSGYRWYELLIFAGYEVDPGSIGLDNRKKMYVFDIPIDIQSTNEFAFFHEILEKEYVSFLRLQKYISFFKIKNTFIRQNHPDFQKIIKEVINFQSICVGIFLPSNYKLVGFEILPNKTNFSSCFSPPQKAPAIKLNPEKNATQLLKDEEKENAKQIAKANAKKERELQRQKALEEAQNLAKMKTLLRKIAIEAKQYVDNKNKQKRTHKNKLINQLYDSFVSDVMADVLYDVVIDSVKEIQAEKLKPKIDLDIKKMLSKIHPCGWHNIGDEIFYSALV